MPPLIAASTPDAWIASAGTYSANGVTSEIDTAISWSDKPARRIATAIFVMSQPIARPAATPATTTYTKLSVAASSENAPVATAITAKR